MSIPSTPTDPTAAASADHEFEVRQLRRALAARDQQLAEVTAQYEQLRWQVAALTAAERLHGMPGGPQLLAMLRLLARVVDRFDTPRRLLRRLVSPRTADRIR